MTNPLQPSLFGDEPMKALRDPGALRAPFPYFGGKSGIASLIWYAFGEVKQYIEPFCGSAAVLLANPSPASLEVAGDVNCYLANFWRALKHQPEAVAAEADYPVSHIDLAARHRWLVEPERVAELAASLADPEWAGDTKIAGWWCWGQCAWIGSGWCESRTDRPTDRPTLSTARSPRSSAGEECSQVPFVGHRGRGLQRGGNGQIPHVTDGGRGIQREREREQIPHLSSAGQGVCRGGSFDGAQLLDWMHALSARLKRVRIIHGSWERCMNVHYGDKGKAAAVFFDPPYVAYERLYGKQEPVALAVAKWCSERPEIKIALCGHGGDYELPGWQVLPWDRGRLTYNGGATTANESIWFSPACRRVL